MQTHVGGNSSELNNKIPPFCRSLSMCQYSLPSLPSPSSPGEEILRFQRQFVARLGPANSFAPPPPGREAKSLVSLPSQPKSRLVPRTLLPRDPSTTLMTRDPNTMLPNLRLPSSSSSTDSGAFSRNSTPEPLLYMQEQVDVGFRL